MNAPESISKYKIARVLGKGSMGVVYEGFDPDIQRRVAIKTLTPNINDQKMVEEFHRRFKIEAQASARCMHPNIVTILEYGDIAGMPFIVMEFIDGSPLDEILALNAPIRFNRALKIFSQLLKGLYFAHQSGVVHRDIKPSNIMVMNEDVVKITDFGIARLPVSSEVTQVGYTVGTPYYMAPEQEASSEVDARADLFSATVILLELLAKVPVTSSVEHLALSPQGIYITPRVNMTQLIPQPFLALIQRGLAFSPANRFESAQRYLVELKQAVTVLQGMTSDEATLGRANAAAEKTLSFSAESAQERKLKLREMEKMLSYYIGPIGTSLIDLHKDKSASIYDLAQKVAQEIASAQDRKQFLRAWESDDVLTAIPKVDTGRVQTAIKSVAQDPNATVMAPSRVHTPQTAKQSLQLNRSELRQVEELFSQYVGPMAAFLLQEKIQTARDMNELVDLLLESIPNSKEKTDFKMKAKKII